MSQDSQDTQDLLDRFKLEYAALLGDPPVTIQMTPVTAWAVMGTIQLACRHPDFTGPTRKLAEHFARNLQDLITPSPALQKVADMGWNPDLDEALT